MLKSSDNVKSSIADHTENWEGTGEAQPSRLGERVGVHQVTAVGGMLKYLGYTQIQSIFKQGFQE